MYILCPVCIQVLAWCVYEVVDTRQEVSETSPLCVECFYVQRLKTLCCQSEKELL